jgi:hypothetical protein
MIDFLGIGAQKCGTSLLYEQLKEVEEIYLPKTKELHFFDKHENYVKGLPWYLSFFRDAKPDQLKGEITPAYLYFQEVPCRIRQSFQEKSNNLKFIVILRNPIDRAYSHYWMEYKRNNESLKFEYAIIKELIYKKKHLQHHVLSYLDRGFYSEQILHWFKFFKRVQFKFIIFEEFITEQNRILNEILEFLGIDKKYTFINKLVFKNHYPPMDEKLRKFLQEIYAEEINALENLLNINLDIWRK